MKTGKFGYFILALLLFIVFSAGCAELPPEDVAGNAISKNTPAQTVLAGGTTPTPEYMTRVTPYSTPEPETKPHITTVPTISAPVTEHFEIYNETIKFMYNTEAFQFNLPTPPMVISYAVEPEMVKETIVKDSDYGKKEKFTKTKTVPDPGAFFVVTIRDISTGDIVQEEGYGRTFGQSSDKNVFKVFSCGNYQIELTGNRVTVKIAIEVPEDNINGVTFQTDTSTCNV